MVYPNLAHPAAQLLHNDERSVLGPKVRADLKKYLHF